MVIYFIENFNLISDGFNVKKLFYLKYGCLYSKFFVIWIPKVRNMSEAIFFHRQACLLLSFLPPLPSTNLLMNSSQIQIWRLQPSFSLLYFLYCIYIPKRILLDFLLFHPWLPCNSYRFSPNKQTYIFIIIIVSYIQLH